MADRNSLVLDAASWLPRGEWDGAPESRRRRFLERVGELAAAKKRRQIAKGVGSDGKPLPAVLPASRPDGADGKPLDPHYAASRAVKWLRDSEGLKQGTVTLWWSHGWGRILGYHARGEVIGAPIRDVIRFPPAYLRELRRDALHFWAGTAPRPSMATAAGAPASIPIARPAPLPRPPRARPAAEAVPVDSPRSVMRPEDRARVERTLASGGEFSGFRRPGRIAPGSLRAHFLGLDKPRTRKPTPKPAPPTTPPPAPKAPPPPPAPKPVPTPARPTPPPAPRPAPAPSRSREEAIEAAVRIATARGVRVDRDAAAALARAFGDEEAARIAAAYQPRTRTILINPASDAWDLSGFTIRVSRATGWLSSDHPDHYIHHELGHAGHHAMIGHQAYLEFPDRAWTDAELSAIGDHVSRYGRTSPIEFVAEVYAGLRAGRAFPRAVLDVYTEFGGPVR